MAKTIIVSENFEEPKRWFLHPVLWLTIGSCLYFTLFWFVIWPVVIEMCKGMLPDSKGWVTLLWIMALIVWSAPLCCIVCYCVFKERRRIDAKMEIRRRHLAKSCGAGAFWGMPLSTNAMTVQPDARLLRLDSPRGLIFPSVIVEEEDDVSLPPSPIMHDRMSGQPPDAASASMQGLYTGSSKRVSLMDRNSDASSILRSEDVEEALKKLSQSTNEDDVFTRGTIATKRSYVQPPEIFVQSSSSVGSAQRKGSWNSSCSSSSSGERPSSSESNFKTIQEHDGVVQSGQDGEVLDEEFSVEEVDDVFPTANVEHGANENCKVLVKQTSQSEFFVGNGYRRQSITSEAIIEFGDSAEPRIYVPGQFKVLAEIDRSDL